MMGEHVGELTILPAKFLGGKGHYGEIEDHDHHAGCAFYGHVYCAAGR